jgi:hypothetical protein
MESGPDEGDDQRREWGLIWTRLPPSRQQQYHPNRAEPVFVTDLSLLHPTQMTCPIRLSEQRSYNHPRHQSR